MRDLMFVLQNLWMELLGAIHYYTHPHKKIEPTPLVDYWQSVAREWHSQVIYSHLVMFCKYQRSRHTINKEAISKTLLIAEVDSSMRSDLDLLEQALEVVIKRYVDGPQQVEDHGLELFTAITNVRLLAGELKLWS